MDRRQFLKRFGTGTLAATGLLAASKSKDDGEGQKAPQEPPTDKRTNRTNHNTGDKVSLLGYGMMRLPVKSEDGKSGTSRELPDAPIDQEMVNREVDYAQEHGLNNIDTSPVYCKGLSEHATGIALRRHPREKYFIATKLSNLSPDAQTREASQEMFENSLRELQTNYIDYLLLHSIGGGNDPLQNFNARFMDNGILDWLVEQKRKGRIRNLGFSYHGDVKIFDMLLQWHDEGRYHWDFAQIELNYLDWDFADEINDRNTDASYLYAELEKRNIPAVVMEPLLGGRLANIPDAAVAMMKSREPEMSVASWAFRYAGTPKDVLCVLSGMTWMEHLKDNLRSYSPLRPITDEENEMLMQIAKKIYDLKTIPCNECNYCMPCPYGIDIPSIFVHYNRCIKEGNLPRLPGSENDGGNDGENDEKQEAARRAARQDPEYRRARRAFLIGYDRSVPRLRQASHCIGCGQCVPLCPQRIQIPSEMQRIDEYAEALKRDE